MEDPMGENKDDNFGSRVEIERKKKKIKEGSKVGVGFVGSRNKEKCEQKRNEESGACMQPHVREGMVFFGNLT